MLILNIFDRIVDSNDGKSIISRYERFKTLLNEKEKVLFDDWAVVVPRLVSVGLDRSLLKRDPVLTLLLNFDQELLAVLKEVNYLKQMHHEDIPREALEVHLNQEWMVAS